MTIKVFHNVNWWVSWFIYSSTAFAVIKQEITLSLFLILSSTLFTASGLYLVTILKKEVLKWFMLEELGIIVAVVFFACFYCFRIELFALFLVTAFVWVFPTKEKITKILKGSSDEDQGED